jgi:hypoxanthine phosphoribosyltransferase
MFFAKKSFIQIMKQIKDKHFVPFIETETLQTRIHELGQEINKDYAEKNPLLVGVLNGSFMFVADLLKNITIDCEITFIRVSSYKNLESSGQVKQILGLKENIQGRHVIIVEDIVDTGLTMQEVLGQMAAMKPESIKIMSLLFKPQALKVPLKIDYIGFEIENRFVVGYGLDYDNLGRNLDKIYVLK